MLEHRKLVGTTRDLIQLISMIALVPRRKIGDVVQELVDQRVFYIDITDLCRFDNRDTTMLAAHPRREELAGIDFLREIFDECTRAKILRPHCQRDVDWDF